MRRKAQNFADRFEEHANRPADSVTPAFHLVETGEFSAQGVREYFR
jgi:hypothetical protein